MTEKYSKKAFTTIFAKEMFKLVIKAPETAEETLDAYRTLESVFKIASAPSDILKILEGNYPAVNIDLRAFETALSKFPIEATFIRAEIRRPRISKELKILDAIHNQISILLASETTTSIQTDKTTSKIFYSKVTGDAGPLSKALSTEDIIALTRTWVLCDALVEEALINSIVPPTPN